MMIVLIMKIINSSTPENIGNERLPIRINSSKVKKTSGVGCNNETTEVVLKKVQISFIARIISYVVSESIIMMIMI